MEFSEKFKIYLKNAGKLPRVTLLEFLNDDGSVAFALGNERANGYMRKRNTSAFIQGGSVRVTNQNGQRRSASVTLSNLDGQFFYAVNHVWFGQRLRIQCGVVLPNGEELLFPQGVFYIKEPPTVWKPNEKTVSFSLVDKFAALDGTVGGVLPYTFVINRSEGGQNVNIFSAIQSVLHLDRFTMAGGASDEFSMIDAVPARFTSYYNDFDPVTYELSDGTTETLAFTDLPYDVNVKGGSNAASIIDEMNGILVGVYGYDANGQFFFEPSQDDISDADKPILYNFTPKNSNFLGISESAKPSEVVNSVIVCGQGGKYAEVFAEASNHDPTSAFAIERIGLRTKWMNEANLCTKTQCADLAKWTLVRNSALPRTVSISCAPIFHLQENALVTVRRSDKEGEPIERHLIQSYTIPLAETGYMTLDAIAVNDIPQIAVRTTV